MVWRCVIGLRGPLPKVEAQPAAPLADLTAPAWLEGEAAAHWDRHASHLAANRLLTTATADAFALHCDLYGKLMDMRGMRPNPTYLNLTKAWNASVRVWHLVPTDKPGGPPTERHAAKGEFDFE